MREVKEARLRTFIFIRRACRGGNQEAGGRVGGGVHEVKEAKGEEAALSTLRRAMCRACSQWED